MEKTKIRLRVNSQIDAKILTEILTKAEYFVKIKKEGIFFNKINVDILIDNIDVRGIK